MTFKVFNLGGLDHYYLKFMFGNLHLTEIYKAIKYCFQKNINYRARTASTLFYVPKVSTNKLASGKIFAFRLQAHIVPKSASKNP